MATKLHQLLAIEPGVAAEGARALTDAHRDSAKDGPLAGLSRTYQPLKDEGERLPSETTRVQFTVAELTARMRPALTRWFDVTAQRDWANMEAAADVVVEGVTLIPGAPVSFLLWLEKRLDDLNTYVRKLPTHDPAETWHFDEQIGQYKSVPVETARTRKAHKPVTLYEATPEHPAQVQLVGYDEIVGKWTIVKFSGAIPESERSKLLDRLGVLRRAVKLAREKANQVEVLDEVLVGGNVLGYLFD